MYTDKFEKYHTKTKEQIMQMTPVMRMQYLRTLDIIIPEEDSHDPGKLAKAEEAARKAGVQLYLKWEVLGEIHYRPHEIRP